MRGYPNANFANGANQRCTHRRDAMTFASKREQSRIYSSYAEREQIVRIKLRLYTMYPAWPLTINHDFVATDKSIENSDIFLPVIKHQFFYIADY